ncbi:MAG: type II secretion system inner membrane protein GspF [Geobacter sp.]|nr:type II secretion system inner membrane protein GspF [Geobacter sp.]
MPTFRYSAYNAAGGEVRGTVDAESQREALARLKKDGLFPKEIIEEGAAPKRPSLFAGRRVGIAQTALMTRRLATLVGSHVPVYEAIATLREQEGEGELKKVLSRLRDRLAAGSTLARAMADEPLVFGESYTGMVAAGEASGALDLVLERLADFLEGEQAVRSRVSTALAYPLLMAIVGSGVMVFLLAFVIPKITVIFEESRATLPFITVALIKVSSLIRSFWWLAAIAVAAAPFGYRRLMTDDAMRCKRDRFLLRLPLAGPLLQQLVLARFARVLGLLLASGVPVIRALEITADAVVNREYRVRIRSAAEDVAQGGSLSSSLGASLLFPPLLVHMVGVGEKGGELEAMLLKAGEAFEREFTGSITRFMALLEPLMVLAMGLAVGIVVLAVLLPIFQLNQLIR